MFLALRGAAPGSTRPCNAGKPTTSGPRRRAFLRIVRRRHARYDGWDVDRPHLGRCCTTTPHRRSRPGSTAAVTSCPLAWRRSHRPVGESSLAVSFGNVRPFIERWAGYRRHLREITKADITTSAGRAARQRASHRGHRAEVAVSSKRNAA